MKIAAALCLLAFSAAPAAAQGESAAHAALAREGHDIGESCGPFSISKIGSCIYTFATVNPIHVTFGSISPGNGVAVGPAVVGHATPSENLRINWSSDAVVSGNGSWRGGAYMNFVRTAVQAPVPVFGDQPLRPAAQDVYPIYSIFAQATSLETVPFYGEGHAPSLAKTSWTLREVVVGGRAEVPVGPSSLGLAIVGGLAVRSFDAAFAPDARLELNDNRSFLQFSEGIKAAPAFGVHVRPLYSLRFDEFAAQGSRVSAAGGVGPGESFTRWTLDVVHEIPFYRIEGPRASAGNSPNDCSGDDGHTCASPSRNRYGAFTLRALTIGALVPQGNSVPYYLEATLGGSDINGQRTLAAYPDAFFRASNAFLVQATAEHSIVAIGLGHGLALPLGAIVMAEAGAVADRWADAFHGLSHSYAAGLTIRAGGFPEVTLVYAWGPPGHHFAATINPALLGGGSRPSLF